VWKHAMRLGVLRQHEPRPLDPVTLPRRLPPPPESAWPLISIVTPSFQQASFVERTMLSVLEQDYPRVEYHVCDGGSVDGSVELIRKHEARLASWTSEGDSGPAEAINRGFARSSGEIMAWLNSDDLLLPGAVRFIADYFARHPEVDVVYGHRLVVDERDWQVGRWVLPRHDGRMLLWADYVPQETLFWRRALWEKTGSALDQGFKFAFDWDILLRFQKAGARIVRLPWFIGCFRVHDSQKSIVEIGTVGMSEMTRLRERELGSCFDEDRLARHVVAMQRKAAWCDRLLRWGLHW
jgi:glycosyltransferase involved in cell wall biosynthesis